MKYNNKFYSGKKSYNKQVKWTDKQNPAYHWQGRDEDLEFNQKKIKNKQSSFRKAVLRRHLIQREKNLNSIILTLNTLNNIDFLVPDDKFKILEIIPHSLYRWYANSYEFRLEYISLDKRLIFFRRRKDYKSADRVNTYGTFGYDDSLYTRSRHGYFNDYYDYDLVPLGVCSNTFSNISNPEIVEGVLKLLHTFYKYSTTNKNCSTFDELMY